MSQLERSLAVGIRSSRCEGDAKLESRNPKSFQVGPHRAIIFLFALFALGLHLTNRVLVAQATKASYDWSTPARALVSLMESYRVGDVAARRESYHAANDQERAFLDALIADMAAGLELQKAWESKFGKLPLWLEPSDPGSWKEGDYVARIDGDVAFVHPRGYEDKGTGMKFIRGGGKWRLSLGQIIELRTSDGRSIESVMQEIHRSRDHQREVAQAIAAGRFAAAAEAEAAFMKDAETQAPVK